MGRRLRHRGHPTADAAADAAAAAAAEATAAAKRQGRGWRRAATGT